MKSKLPGIVFVVSCVLVVAINACASYLPYWTMDGILVGAAVLFFLGVVLVVFVPARQLITPWILAGGGWILALRFTGDMGQQHESGTLLIASLLVFTMVLAIKTLAASREIAQDNADSDIKGNR